MASGFLTTHLRALINRLGQWLEFSRPGSRTYDTSSGSMTEQRESSWKVKTLLGAYSLTAVAFSNGLLEVGDYRAFVADSAYQPQAGDTVDINGRAYRVERVRDHPLSGVSELLLRQA